MKPGHRYCQLSKRVASWQTRPAVNKMPPGISSPVALRSVIEKYIQWKNSPTGMTNRVGQNWPKIVPALTASLRKKSRQMPISTSAGPINDFLFKFIPRSPLPMYSLSTAYNKIAARFFGLWGSCELDLGPVRV